MTESEIDPAVRTVFNVASGYFPKSSVPGSKAVQFTWGQKLIPRFSPEDICAAFAALSEYIGSSRDTKRRTDIFPDLAEVIEATVVARDKRLDAGPVRALTPPQKHSLSEYKASMRLSRAWLKTESRDSARLYKWAPGKLENRLAEIERVGPHEAAGFRKVRDGVEGNVNLDELHQSLESFLVLAAETTNG